ncbi:MAG: DNA-binding protein [Ruminiclostridium sp.]|nr:DNA-binding protein [Ruminiclostridium sp.]
MAKELELAILLDLYEPLLTDKQRDTLDLYYNEDLSLAEIAETTGTTRQAVMKCIHNTEHNLRELEEKLKLAEKAGTAEKLLTQLETLTAGSINEEECGKIIRKIRELL